MIVYDTDHVTSQTVCKAVGKGFGWDVSVAPWQRPLTGPAAIYGRDRGTLHVMRQCKADRVPWYFVDNGYLGTRVSLGISDCFYMITRNAYQHDGRGKPDEARLSRLLDIVGGSFEPWRKTRQRGHILVCPPIHEYDRVHYFWSAMWLRKTTKEIQQFTSRPLRLRYKPGDSRQPKARSLEKDFNGCHAVVTHDSNIVVEAIMAGVPAFVTGESPVAVLGNVDLGAIESPRFGDQEEWLAILAANQWTLDEIRQGAANETLGIK